MSQTGRYHRPDRGVLRSSKRRKRGYLLIITVTTVLVAVAAAITFFTYQVVTSPDQFTPKKLVIKGAVFAESQLIQEKVNQSIGSNMLLADLEQICQQVEQLPWVLSASARKIIPDTLELNLVERKPVAFAAMDTVLMLVDDTGETICPLTADLPFTDLPLIAGLEEYDQEAGAVRLKTGVEIIKKLVRRAVWKKRLQQVNVSVAGGERVHLKDGLAPVIIGASDIDRRLTKYLIVEAALRERYYAVEYIDVRFNDQVVVNGTGN